MDFAPIIINALSMVWFLIPLFLLPIVLKSAWFKGLWGDLDHYLG